MRVLKSLSRIIFLAPVFGLMSCVETGLPTVSETPKAATSSLIVSSPDEQEFADFAATGAECGIDEREVATMVYLPTRGSLGPGALGCTSLRPPARVKDTELHEELWEMSKALIPDRDERRIKRVILAQDRRSDTLAFVASLDDDGRTWEYGLNLDAVNLNNSRAYEELLSTIIHEYAHILSLNDTQVSYDPAQQAAYTDISVSDEEYEALTIRAEQRCDSKGGIYDGDACYQPGSHIFEFYMSFWDGYGEDVFAPAARGSIYDRNKSDFVNDYAGTSPSEDFAETFAAWVMPELEAFEITDAVRAKFNFFNSRPSLVNIRNSMLTGLVSLRG